MESGKLLLQKVHDLIEKANKPPPKLKPHEIFEMKKPGKKSKSFPQRNKKRRHKLRKVQSTKN